MRTVAAILTAIIIGGVTVPFLFDDFASWESAALRIVIAAILFVGGGIIVGLIAPRRWRLSAICAWFGILVGLLMLFSKLRMGDTPPYWAAILAYLVAPLAASLTGGYLGFRIRMRREALREPYETYPES